MAAFPAARRSAASSTPQAGQPRTAQAAGVELIGATKRFVSPNGEAFTALHDFTLTIEPGQFCAIVGPDRLRQVDDARRWCPALTARAPAPSPWAAAGSMASPRGPASCSSPMP